VDGLDDVSGAGDGRSAATAVRDSWYLVHCKPREDERALEHLERQGFECFQPVRKTERHRRGKRWWVSEALFPRYVFIHLNSVEDNWYPIRSTRGVCRIVRFNEHPLAVRDEIIEGLRLRLGEAQAEPYFKPGERVRIAEGPFTNLEAIFLAEDGDERVVLLMNILQQDQRLSFPAEIVRRAS
jgi:transcriptional antiterminator RfaH